MRKLPSLAVFFVLLCSLAFAANGPVSVTFSRHAGGPSAEGLNFTYTIGDPLPGAASGEVTSSVGSAQFSISASQPWILVSPTSGTTPASFEVSVNPTGLAPGNYSGSITVRTSYTDASGRVVVGSDTAAISLKVVAATPVAVTCPAGTLAFTGNVGGVIPSLSLNVTGASKPLNYTVSSDHNWLGAASGVTGTPSAVSINPAGLAAGSYNGVLTVNIPGAQPASCTVAVTLTLARVMDTLNPAPPAQLSFRGVQNGVVPAPQTFSVSAGTANSPFSLTSQALPAWLTTVPPSSGTTPQSFTVGVNQAGLAPGTYNYDLTYAYPNTAAGSYTTRVTLVVDLPPAPQVSVSPHPLAFNANAGATTNPAPATVTISALVDGIEANAAVAVTSKPSWVQVQVSGNTPSSVIVTPDIIGHAAGTLSGDIVLTVGTTPSVTTVTVPVTIIISASGLQVAPTGVSASGIAGQHATGPQASLQFTAASPVSFSVAPAAATPWLSVDAGSGVAPQVVTVMADAAALTAGTYTATLNVTVAGQVVATIPVDFTVAAAPPPLEVAAVELSFQAFARGAVTAAQSFAVTTNPGMLAYTVAADPWIVTSSSGSGSGAISVQVDPRTLDPGKYGGTVTITGGGSTKTVTVTVTVTGPNAPNFASDPGSVSFTQSQFATGVPRQTVTLTGLDPSLAGNTLLTWDVSANVSGASNWLNVGQIDTGAFPFSFNVWADPAGLVPGSYSGTITITAAGGTSASVSVPVTLTITEPIRNSFSFGSDVFEATKVFGAPGQEQFSVDLIPASAGLTYTVATTGGSWLKVDDSGAGSMPSSIRLTADSTGLPVGVHRGTVVVTADAAQGVVVNPKVRSVSVVLTVQAPPPARLEASAIGSGQFTVDTNYPAMNVTALPVTSVVNKGYGNVPVTVASDTPWLVFDSSSFTVGQTPTAVSARVALDKLPGGTGGFSGSFRLIQNGAAFYTGSVSVHVAASVPQFDIRPVGATLSGIAGYTSPMTTSATIVNTGGVPVTFGVSSSATWLGVSTSSGTLNPGQSQGLDLTVAPGLGAGLHSASVSVTVTVGTAVTVKTFDIAVQLQASGPPQVSPGDVVLTLAAGAFSRQYTISNPSGAALPYYVSTAPLAELRYTTTCFRLQCTSTPYWANMPAAVSSLSNASGTIPAGGSVVVTATGTRGAAPQGSTILFNVGYNTFSRTLEVYSASAPAGKETAAGSCEANNYIARITNLNRDSKLTAGLPAAIRVTFLDGCGVPQNKGLVFAEFSNSDPRIMLQATGADGVWAGTWIPRAGTAPTVEVSLVALNASETLGTMTKVTVGLDQAGGVPIVQANGIVNSADYGAPMVTAAGSYLSIFGTSLAPAASVPAGGIAETVGTTQVKLGKQVLPLVYVSPGQINAFVPYNVSCESTLPLQVLRGGIASVSRPVSVEVRRPAMFLKDGTTARPGLVVAYRGAQSFIVDAAHPVVAGDVLVLYTLGLGPVDQDLAPYKISPAAPPAKVKGSVKVTIGGKVAPVQFSGLSPESRGLYQVNAQVPAGIEPGNQVPVVITVEGSSTSLTTVPVR